MTSQAPAPGWYPDPKGGSGEKYWDGQEWRADGSARSGGVAPHNGVGPSGAVSDKSKMVAGLLQIFLGGFGIGRFYLGYTQIAILQIVVSVVTCGIGTLWPLVDGIMILMGKVPDAEGRALAE
jgi:TM2 domain-containing membrane protein YozV